MAITQSRMIALIEAAKWFRDERRNLTGLIQDLMRDGQIQRERVLDLVARAYTVVEPASHAETIMAEDVHFKHVGRKNDLARQRAEHAYRESLGLEPEPFPVPKRRYPQEIEQPANRRPPTQYAPSLQQRRPFSAIAKLTEDEQLELDMLKAAPAATRSFTPQEQQAWARANGYSEKGFNPILNDSSAGQIPEMRFKQQEREDD